MHGGYLRTYAPRLRQQLVVLNRSDLLSADDAARVSDDMRAQLRREGLADIGVVTTRAREGTVGSVVAMSSRSGSTAGASEPRICQLRR